MLLSQVTKADAAGAAPGLDGAGGSLVVPLAVETPDQAAVPPPGRRAGGLARVKTFESLRFRDYRLLWLGQGGTSMGQWMDQVARGWLIYQMTGSPLQLGAVSATRAIPMLLFGVMAGVVADRYARRAQLVVSQVVNIFINIVLATLVLTGRVEPWHVYVTALLAGTVQAFQQPARQSLISDLVDKEHLLNAVALNSAIFNLMRSIGPALAGALIALVGVDGSYYAQAALYVWATVWTVQMKVPGEPSLGELLRLRRRQTPPEAPQMEHATVSPSPTIGKPGQSRIASHRHLASDSFFGSMGEGFRYIWGNRLILWLMCLGLAPVLLGMPYVSLMPIFALDVLQVGAFGQGLLLTSAGIGALLGALGIASLGSFHRKGMLLLAGAILFGLSLTAFSLSTSMLLSMVLLFGAGLFNASYTSQDQTIIQTLTPGHLRGRVLGIYMLNRGLMPLGSLLAGAIADWFSGPWAVMVMGASCTVIALIVAVKAPRIRELDI
ncbi:MAG: MFS transporter [Actinobacteria bacterium]|nr:MFS transporter [Actinomycetota bacterium]